MNYKVLICLLILLINHINCDGNKKFFTFNVSNEVVYTIKKPYPNQLVTIYSYDKILNISIGNKNYIVNQLTLDYGVTKITIKSNESNVPVLVLYQDLSNVCNDNYQFKSLSQTIKRYNWLQRLTFGNICNDNQDFSYKLTYYPSYPKTLSWASNKSEYNIENYMSNFISYLKGIKLENKEFINIKDLSFNMFNRVNYYGFFVLTQISRDDSDSYFDYPPIMLIPDNFNVLPRYTIYIFIGAIVFGIVMFIFGTCVELIQIGVSTWCIVLIIYSYCINVQFGNLGSIFDDQYSKWFFIIFFGLGPLSGIIMMFIAIMISKPQTRFRILFTSLVFSYVWMSIVWFIITVFVNNIKINLPVATVSAFLIFCLLIACNRIALAYCTVSIGLLIIALGAVSLTLPTSILPYLFVDIFVLRDTMDSSNWNRHILFPTVEDFIIFPVLFFLTLFIGSLRYSCIRNKTTPLKQKVQPAQNQNRPVQIPESPNYGAVHYREQTVFMQVAGISSEQPMGVAPPRYSDIMMFDGGKAKPTAPNPGNNIYNAIREE